MKPIYLLPIIIFFFVSCQQEEALLNKKQIRFNIPVAADSHQNEIDKLSLQLTLTDLSGNTVVSRRDISLSGEGDRLVSGNIDLPRGSYSVQEFLVTNSEGQVVHALPRKNSPLALQAINLIHEFSIGESDSNEISVSVLPVEGRTAQDFGYAPGSFKTYSIRVSVSVHENARLKMTDATAYIQSDDGENYLYDLAAKVNTMNFAGDPNKQYKLLVWKEGYKVHARDFVYNDLHSEIHGRPLEIILEEDDSEPGPEVTIQPSSDYFSMWIEVSQQGMIILDWGNGETESLMFNVDPDDMTGTGYFMRDREYSGERPAIRLSGDIHLITGLFLDTSVSSVDVEYAPALQGISLTDSNISTLDLDVNTGLRWFSFVSSSIDILTLPQQHGIRDIMITTNGLWPSSSQLDYVIENIHMNAVAGNFTGGTFTLEVNAISDQGTAHLAELRDSYGWEVRY
jgi:hypothetical protein